MQRDSSCVQGHQVALSNSRGGQGLEDLQKKPPPFCLLTDFLIHLDEELMRKGSRNPRAASEHFLTVSSQWLFLVSSKQTPTVLSKR